MVHQVSEDQSVQQTVGFIGRWLVSNRREIFRLSSSDAVRGGAHAAKYTRIAQQRRAGALQAQGRGFDPLCGYQMQVSYSGLLHRLAKSDTRVQIPLLAPTHRYSASGNTTVSKTEIRGSIPRAGAKEEIRLQDPDGCGCSASTYISL